MPGDDADSFEPQVGKRPIQVNATADPLKQSNVNELTDAPIESVVIVVIEKEPQSAGGDYRKLSALAENQHPNGVRQ